ncbi:helix-turn-helix transcriptional regulator [Flammeovirga sp. MY04]|uniref:helix-turn-helix transcriptional regulator n=1 Tax=Flammeovirga sp. MY04 TaxID=1191459 RepID=UPI000806408C|nr:AraC family transcriptional regulator [Flammeovirga sp. MY04]ANQ52651.1 helix-turn-helix transcriptional regulator [Flammeovirga sp. MY04]
MDKIFRTTASGHKSSEETLRLINEQFTSASFDGYHFLYEEGDYFINSQIYPDLTEVEVGVTKAFLPIDMILEEEESSDKTLILRFGKELSSYDDEKDIIKIKNQKANGAMLFFNNKLQRSFIPKDQLIHFINIRVKIEDINKITRNRFPKFVEAMVNNKPLFFYELLTLEMEELIEKIFDLQETDMGRIGLTLGYSIQLFTLFFMQLETRMDNDGFANFKVDSKLMFQIKDYLLDNLDQQISTEMICEKYGISPQKLRNHFKAAFGYPPHQFVLQSRLLQAKKMLQDPNNSLTDIAYSLGFANPNHFSKAFKKNFGVAPKKYRK